MRDIKLLHPKVQELAEELVKRCGEKKLSIKITDTLRTKEEQDKLYAQGRTAPGKIVTKVAYPKSNHIWGIAFDFCRNDGKGAYENKDGFFQKVGKVGKELGLSWGGDFKSIVDMPHFEYTKFGNWEKLQEKYKTPEGFFKTFPKAKEELKKDKVKIDTVEKAEKSKAEVKKAPAEKSKTEEKRVPAEKSKAEVKKEPVEKAVKTKTEVKKAPDKKEAEKKAEKKTEKPADYIGALVKEFESGNRGSLALVCCGNDYGISCGSYQLTLRWGNCIDFLKKYYPKEAKELYFNNTKKDMPLKEWPGKEYCSSPAEVKKVWMACYEKAGAQAFFQSEHDYIQKKYYEQLLKKLKGFFDPNKHSRMAQECLWSWTVHKGVGGAEKYFRDAVGKKDPQSMNGAELIDLLYDKRYSVDSFSRYKKGAAGSEREKLRPFCKTAPLPFKE